VVHLRNSLVETINIYDNVILQKIWKRNKFVQKDLGDHEGQKIDNQEKNKAESVQER
jgi:hypothetical protein